MNAWCDRVVSGGIFFLIIFTPFAFGSVHPWAFIMLESAVFFLAAAAMVKLFYLRRWPGSLGPWAGQLAAPYLLFIALIVLQLLPIPPALLSLLSPNGYSLYQTSLPGWPERPPYAELLRDNGPVRQAQPQMLPTPEQIRRGATVPFGDLKGAANLNDNASGAKTPIVSLFPESWRALSIAPSLTVTDLVKFLAYGALFFLIVFYPFGATEPSPQSLGAARPRAEVTFLRSLFLVLLVSGSMVALVGILQLFAGNGKILWFFVPYDWDSFSAGLRSRASGPFINPDHFANYLSLIFPFSLAFALRPPPWFPPAVARSVRAVCASTALLIFIAIVLSLSRFGWVSALLGIGLLIWLDPSGGFLQYRQNRFTIVCAGAIMVLLLIVSIWLIGPQSRQAIDLRLAESVANDGALGSRLSVWRGSLSMIRDFPLSGIGLGAWPDLFPRYQAPSAAEIFYREAHNDFLELLAETGVVGFALLGLFFVQGGRIVLRGLSDAPVNLRSVFIPCVAALAIMSVHEFFDFSLQIPANAVLFTVLFGISVRLALTILLPQPPRNQALNRWIAASGMAFSVALIFLAFSQDLVPYPYNLRAPSNIAEAAERIAAHPAQAAGHAMIARLIADRAPSSRQTQEYAIAAWLQPGDPNLRDLYASALLREGRREQGLQEISASVALAPVMTRHFYLDEKLSPFLLSDEKRAIESGFQQASARGDLPAMENLALFYQRTGQWLEQAKLFETMRTQATDAQAKTEFALKAAQSYLAANQPAKAEELLRNVVSLQPTDPRPYQALAVSVYAPRGKREQIAAVIAEGIDNQADAFPLYLALAEAMKQTGAAEVASQALKNAAESIAAAARGENVLPLYLSLAETARRVGLPEREQLALERALELRPYASEILQPLGDLYLDRRRYDRAAFVFKRLTDLRPTSAASFYQLGLAAEGRYDFSAADAAYSRAAELAPDNKDFRGRRDQFKQKLAASLTLNSN